MNREIKFRVYDVRNNKLIYLDSVNLSLTNCNRHTNGKYIGQVSVRFQNQTGYELEKIPVFPMTTENFKIQQSVGLSDVSGKELYEGDLVIFFEGKPYQAIYEVVYDDGSFVFVDHKREGDDFGVYKKLISSIKTDKGKIIGNIYEQRN